MSYRRYPHPDGQAPASTGWDAWSSDYATLGSTNPVYRVGKDLLHGLVDDIVSPPVGGDAWMLDFHCGAGDDLTRFLARGWRAVGCDGSPGMLASAAARLSSELREGRVELWQGRAEELTNDAFQGRRFDLVFSTTGGFAYLEDDAFVRVHQELASMVTANGVLVIAHLAPFCAAETLFHMSRLRARRAIARWRRRVPIEVRGEQMLMRLRSPADIRRLLAGVVRIDRLAPLLVCTPPFQTGFTPGQMLLQALVSVEKELGRFDALAAIADQVVCIARPLPVAASLDDPG